MRRSRDGSKNIVRGSTDEALLAGHHILLDLFLDRPPWAAHAEAIWDAHRQGLIRASVAAFSIPTVFCVVRKQDGIPAACKAVDACLRTLDIAPTDRATLLAARSLSGADFEDDAQIATSVELGVDAIVSRNQTDFSGSPIPVLTPADVVASLPPTSATP